MQILGGMKRSGDCGRGWYGRWKFSIGWPGYSDPLIWFDNGKLWPGMLRVYVFPFFFAVQL